MKPDYVAQVPSPLDKRAQPKSEPILVADQTPLKSEQPPTQKPTTVRVKGFDRLAYQREYMRKRRAAAKATREK